MVELDDLKDLFQRDDSVTHIAHLREPGPAVSKVVPELQGILGASLAPGMLDSTELSTG